MEIYNSIIHYKCSHCSTEVDIKPTSSIGVATTVGILVFVFWAVIMCQGSAATAPGPVSWLTYSIAVIAYFSFTFEPLFKHWKNPPIEDVAPGPKLTEADGDHFARKPILWIERFGLFTGLLAPILFVVCILGVATLIGFINFTYFQ